MGPPIPHGGMAYAHMTPAFNIALALWLALGDGAAGAGRPPGAAGRREDDVAGPEARH
eukprot:CAMPEP_0202779428 /NCGR_PEP_ID=MMETSP1388-20130828/56724_1 /ASSEMBLY_ACC=CAM_ASM_000864 /TAXON_ID=37098 /ORGANISM="Isochrysis sp, Strain CCMP1244" /LENGTH=57 /DNA_ID=CAMNT_0049448751 /DNA_START=83 /DNA_END=254 /DNA_ORIENTATION=-